MVIVGKIIEILPVMSGEVNDKPWKRGGFVVETIDGFNKCLALECFSEALDRYQVQVGMLVKATYRVSSRKAGDRWFTSASCSGLDYLT